MNCTPWKKPFGGNCMQVPVARTGTSCTKHVNFQNTQCRRLNPKMSGFDKIRTFRSKTDNENTSFKRINRRKLKAALPSSNGDHSKDSLMSKPRSAKWKQKSSRKTAIISPRPRQDYQLTGSGGWVYNVSRVEYGRNTPPHTSVRSQGMIC